MFSISPMTRIPVDFDLHVREIAAGIHGLFGARAAARYVEVATEGIRTCLAWDAVKAFLATDGDASAGFILGQIRHGIGFIDLVHVRKEYAGRGIEHGLVERCVEALRSQQLEGIISEFIPFSEMELPEAYGALGFERIPRALMNASLERPHPRGTAAVSCVTATKEHYLQMAETIVDAYRGHPGRSLHVEVREPEYAMEYIRRVAAEEFGECRPEYLRAALADDRVVGALLGCRVAPGHGFILHVAVRRDCQQRGIGAELVQSIARKFETEHLTHMALGVTLNNPSFRLYQRLGFSVSRPVDAFTWWQQ